MEIGKDGKPTGDTWPNTGIGRLNPDGSEGSCTACHGRHRFSKAQARTPATCGKCHVGPDHPQIEVYNESKHGIIYRAKVDETNLESDKWEAGSDYSDAPTCATCQMSRGGGQGKTHNVGDRISWDLRSPISNKINLVKLQNGQAFDVPDGKPLPKVGDKAKDSLIEVLLEYKSGERDSTIMGRIAKGYSENELKAIASFMAAQPWVSSQVKTDPKLVAMGKNIHKEKCKAYHEDGGRVQEDDTPRLAGQWPEFTLHYLHDCHKKGRRCAPRKMGKRVMQLSDDELKAMAHYYASEK